MKERSSNRLAGNALAIAACGAVVLFMGQTTRRINALEARVGTPVAPSAARPTEVASVQPEGLSIGRTDAPVTLVQFTDYECPFCRRFNDETLPALMKDYIAAGHVRLVIRDFPMPSHKHANALALASRCAAEMTSELPDFHTSLYAHAAEGADKAIATAASRVGIPASDLMDCVKEGRYSPQVERDIADAHAIGVSGTPSFVVGPTGPLVEGVVIRGARPPAVFSAVIDSILKAAR